MSKQRALELCDESDSRLSQYTTDFNLGPLARSVQNGIDAIRELAKDEPAEAIDELAKTDPEATTLDEVVDRLDELIKAVHELTEVCCSISKNTF